ncbi:MAG: hypothetical protein N4J56_007360 [Chroococcidiopsis sp. SAG 2025]|uniref:hypothetical protein n=1 Tax=Chroococcidiopsis sp. SAG 2025 TaxID=171389 RepID=UPI0029373E07|nr:hypothetical protein [Chroococcidiopsis sp. SAG 2025]MDV2997655.1 hypothetical protein [Chroococcidiopsis sp. SAG 2025]
MAGAEGKTGNPGQKNPKKRAGGSFKPIRSEPKGANMCVRPPQSLESRIKGVLSESGLKVAEFLELAAIAYLERSPEQMRQELAQLLEAEQFNVDPSKPIPRNARRNFESPTEAGQELEQRQLSSDDSGTEEPTATTSDEAPASGSGNTRGQKQQAGDTKTSGKGKRSPKKH